MTSPAAPRVSWVLLVVVVAALAVGAAASILVGTSSAPAPSSAPTPLIFLPPWLIAIASFGIIAFVIGSLVLLRMSGGPALSMQRTTVTALATVLAALVFLVVVHLLGFGTSPAGTNNTSGHGGGGTTPPPSGGHNVTTGSGGVFTWAGVPPWLPFVILAAVVLLAVVVAVPGLREYLAGRRGAAARPIRSAEEAAVREALTQASTDFRRGADPRAVILALYAALLERLEPMVVGLDSRTPEEIRAVHLEHLGVRPGPARTLTRLFEEARYSSHPMGAEESERAAEAVRAALDDLDRRDFPS